MKSLATCCALEGIGFALAVPLTRARALTGERGGRLPGFESHGPVTISWGNGSADQWLGSDPQKRHKVGYLASARCALA
jgi:hypothetical protein